MEAAQRSTWCDSCKLSTYWRYWIDTEAPMIGSAFQPLETNSILTCNGEKVDEW